MVRAVVAVSVALVGLSGLAVVASADRVASKVTVHNETEGVYFGSVKSDNPK